jgi:hypothetical protein
MSDAKSKNILEIEESKREIKCTKEAFETLFDTIIDSSLFALLFSNALSTLISDFVVSEIVVVC